MCGGEARARVGRSPRAGLKRGAAATVDALHLEPVGETHKKTHGLASVFDFIPPTHTKFMSMVTVA